MAGHSKWANIKHKKDKADRQKGKIFSKIAKEIISSVKMQGAEPKNNPRLRLALQKAKEVNFPNENVERNIKKASSAEGQNYESITYEMYGYGGVGILVAVTTDNKNRAASEIRIAINKRGGVIANPGAVAFNFERKGVIQIDKNSTRQTAEELFGAVLEAGAEDFEQAEEAYIIVTDPAELYAVKEQLDGKDIASTESALEYLPKMLVACNAEHQRANMALIEWLEDIEDVDEVYHNMEV